MDSKTKALAIRLIRIKDELETVTFQLLDNKYVTLSDERKMMTAITELSFLELLDDFINEV